jgi:hypothetical protein
MREGVCCLCGDSLAVAAQVYTYRRYADLDFVLSKLCEAHFDAFEHSLQECHHVGLDVSLDDFNAWLCKLLKRYADMKRNGHPMDRCELIRHGCRCVRFAKTTADGHRVCAIHAASIKRTHGASSWTFGAPTGPGPSLASALNVLLGTASY